MSLPLRFKAVCTEMGKEYHLPDLYLAFTPTQPKGSGMCFGLFHEEIDGFLFKKMPEICQSTGLHDSKGQEVFFGDVLTTPSGKILTSVEFYTDQILGENLDDNILSELSDIQLLTVIGNKWMAADELKRRAEAINID